MKPIRVMLADDHALVRAGIRVLLQKLPDVQVVAEAENGAEALELVAKHHPQIVLMDITMPEMSGLEATARITQEYPDIRVIILSMHVDQEYVLGALRAGAKGYLLKGARQSELELAVNAVARGETYLSPAASKHVIREMVEPGGGTENLLERLTPRQRQVLKLIAEGRSRKQIAQTMDISAKTVDTFRAQLMQTLDIHDVAGLVRFAIKDGLVK